MKVAKEFRAAVERFDLDAIMETFADDARLFSPVVFAPFEGKDAIRVLFRILLEVFEDFHYVDELEGDGTHALIFRTRVAGRDVQGLDYFRAGADGRIDEFTVMVRPRSASDALMQEVGSRLAKLGVSH
ncbi:MAG: nuclear transport factor 2 family protein [Myxococcota bacterium]|nr:nuclear transport factor 2 family protein [Myxococcales bacterium]